jgi:hypothetical protein
VAVGPQQTSAAQNVAVGPQTSSAQNVAVGPQQASSAQNVAVGPQVSAQNTVVGPSTELPDVEPLSPARSAPVSYTVNTFGFGANHNAALLKGISEAGNGLYFYIKDKDVVGPAFVDCVGGLLSVVGQRLVLDLEGTNGVEVVEVLTSFPTIRTGAKVSVSIRDLQSEEARDLLCVVKVPNVTAPGVQDVLKCQLDYDNCVTSAHDTVFATASLNRAAPDDPELKSITKSLAVNEQVNRILAANALHESTALANQHKLKEARELLHSAMEELKSSTTGSYESTVGLVQGLQKALDGLQNEQVYQSTGSKVNANLSQAYHQQRSSPMTEGMSSYGNSKKSKMKSAYASAF